MVIRCGRYQQAVPIRAYKRQNRTIFALAKS